MAARACLLGERSDGEHCHDVSCKLHSHAALLTATCTNCQQIPKKQRTSYVSSDVWTLCIDLFVVAVWVFTVSRPDIHTYIYTYIQYINMPLCISCLSVPICARWSFVHSTLTREEKPAITPKNNAMLRNSRCKSHHVEVQAVPVLDATGRQLPGGQSSTKSVSVTPREPKKWVQVTITGRSH